MAQLVSAKNFLVSYDPSNPTNSDGKKYRGTAHEFQDYAYRLASDLRDLEHLHIYMKYAKNYPRYLLEEVYQYIADIDESNKGKLFMWRFKQVREELALQKLLKDFSWETIFKRTSSLQNSLFKSILRKGEDIQRNPLMRILPLIDKSMLQKKTKVLLVDPYSSAPFTVFGTLEEAKVFSINTSRNIAKHYKQLFEKEKNIKCIQKDFFKNSYRDLYFDLIIVDGLWTSVPLEMELQLLKEFSRMLRPEGPVFVKTKSSQENSQKWMQLGNAPDQLYFEKKNSQLEFGNTVSSSGFELFQNISVEKYVVYELRKSIQ